MPSLAMDVLRVCPTCGGEFHPRKDRVDTQICCVRDCNTLYQRGRPKIGLSEKLQVYYSDPEKRELRRQEQLRLHAEHPEWYSCVAIRTRASLIGAGLLEHPRPLLGTHFSEERKQVQRENSERNWLDPVYRKKVCKRPEMSLPEIKFASLVQAHSLPYQFVGNGGLWLGRRNPDFVHLSELRLIEIWGDYYHKGQKPEDRVAYFEKFGYQTLVIWASALPMQGSQMIKAQKEKAVLDRLFAFEGGT